MKNMKNVKFKEEDEPKAKGNKEKNKIK